LYLIERQWIPPRKRLGIRTGLEIIIPKGYYGRIQSNIQLALLGIDVIPYNLSSNFDGEILVILFNPNDEQFLIKEGYCIGELVFQKGLDVTMLISNKVHPVSQYDFGKKVKHLCRFRELNK